MVKFLSSMGVFVVDAIGGALEHTIDFTGSVATMILPATGEKVHLPGAKYIVGASEITNGIVRGTENGVDLVKDGLNSVAKVTSGAVLICPADQQPRRGIRAAFKEQAGTVARAFQGAVTDVTTQTLGEEIGEATRLNLSTAGHTVTLCASALGLPSAVSPDNFMPFGPTLVNAVVHRVVG